MAASMELPLFRKMWTPIAAASDWLVATMPRVANTGERPHVTRGTDVDAVKPDALCSP
jgi:hypothetical protein